MNIQTQRLILRKFVPEDAQDVFEYAANPNCGPDAGWKPHEDISYTKSLVEQWQDSPIILAVCLKDSGKVIGHLSYVADKNRAVHAMEIGYVLNEVYWNNGYTTEACKALIDYCIQTYGVQLITCRCSYLNKRSQAVIKKLGMQFEGITRFERVHPLTNQLIHTYNYSMTVNEFHSHDDK